MTTKKVTVVGKSKKDTSPPPSSASSSDDEGKKKVKEKRTKQPSAYNVMLGEFMKKIAIEEKEKPEDERIPRNMRMKCAQDMYRTWKADHPAGPKEEKKDKKDTAHEHKDKKDTAHEHKDKKEVKHKPAAKA